MLSSTEKFLIVTYTDISLISTRSPSYTMVFFSDKTYFSVRRLPHLAQFQCDANHFCARRLFTYLHPGHIYSTSNAHFKLIWVYVINSLKLRLGLLACPRQWASISISRHPLVRHKLVRVLIPCGRLVCRKEGGVRPQDWRSKYIPERQSTVLQLKFAGERLVHILNPRVGKMYKNHTSFQVNIAYWIAFMVGNGRYRFRGCQGSFGSCSA